MGFPWGVIEHWIGAVNMRRLGSFAERSFICRAHTVYHIIHLIFLFCPRTAGAHTRPSRLGLRLPDPAAGAACASPHAHPRVSASGTGIRAAAPAPADDTRDRTKNVYRERRTGTSTTTLTAVHQVRRCAVRYFPLMYAAGSRPMRNSLLGAPGCAAADCSVSHQM